MKEKKKYLEGTAQVLANSQREKEPYFTTVNGKRIIVHPNVFSPKYFTDTEFFVKELPIRNGETFLEIGPGTGILSITAVLKGAKEVYAIDINPAAVANTKENVKLYGLGDRITVLEGDLFSPLTTQKFDTIFWNTPFGYTKRNDLTILERAIFDSGYQHTKRFVHDAKKHLKPNGRVLIGFSSTLGHYTELRRLLKKAHYKIKLLKQISSTEIYPVKFELLEATSIPLLCNAAESHS